MFHESSPLDLKNKLAKMLQTQPLTFLLVFSYLDPRLWPSQSCSFGFLSSDTSICSTMASPPLRYSDHVAVLISINFPSNSQWNALFYLIAYDYSCADWDSLPDHLRDVPWEDIFKLSASAAASDLCEWVQVDIDIYISLIVTIRSSFTHLHGFQLLMLLP